MYAFEKLKKEDVKKTEDKEQYIEKIIDAVLKIDDRQFNAVLNELLIPLKELGLKKDKKGVETLKRIIENDFNVEFVFSGNIQKVPFVFESEKNKIVVTVNKNIFDSLETEGKMKFFMDILITIIVLYMRFMMEKINAIYYFNLENFIDQMIYTKIDGFSKKIMEKL